MATKRSPVNDTLSWRRGRRLAGFKASNSNSCMTFPSPQGHGKRFDAKRVDNSSKRKRGMAWQCVFARVCARMRPRERRRSERNGHSSWCERSPRRASQVHASAAVAWAEEAELTCFEHLLLRAGALAPPTGPGRHREHHQAYIRGLKHVLRLFSCARQVLAIACCSSHHKLCRTPEPGRLPTFSGYRPRCADLCSVVLARFDLFASS